jgi:hypothetical protein
MIAVVARAGTVMVFAPDWSTNCVTVPEAATVEIVRGPMVTLPWGRSSTVPVMLTEPVAAKLLLLY